MYIQLEDGTNESESGSKPRFRQHSSIPQPLHVVACVHHQPPSASREHMHPKHEPQRHNNRFQKDPCVHRHGPDRESACPPILLRLTAREVADLWHLLPGNDPMEPVWDHAGAEGRSELRLDRLTQVHHQARSSVKKSQKPAEKFPERFQADFSSTQIYYFRITW